MSKNEECDPKLNEIPEIFDKIESYIHKLLEFCGDDNEEVRLRALETLQNIKTSEVDIIVRKALSDPDELVRTTGLEILGAWKDRGALPQIVECLSDENWLVRSEAALALAEIEAVDFIECIEHNLESADDEENVRLSFALYKLGKHEYWPRFLNGFFHDFYRVRCATANLLPALVTPTNKTFLMNLLLTVLKNEETKAAASSIENALEEIKHMNLS